jgi:hypothetical protein
VTTAEANYRVWTSPALAGALARLREHVNVSGPEQAEIFIRDLYGKRAAGLGLDSADMDLVREGLDVIKSDYEGSSEPPPAKRARLEALRARLEGQ